MGYTTIGKVLFNVLRTGGMGTASTFGDKSVLISTIGSNAGKVFIGDTDTLSLTSTGVDIFVTCPGNTYVEVFSNGHSSTLTYQVFYESLGGPTSNWFREWEPGKGFSTTAGAGYVSPSLQYNDAYGYNSTGVWDVYSYAPHLPTGFCSLYLNRRSQSLWQINVEFGIGDGIFDYYSNAWSIYRRVLWTYTKSGGGRDSEDPRGTYTYLQTDYIETGAQLRITTGSGYLGPCAPGTLTIS